MGLRAVMSKPSSSEPMDPHLVQLVAGGDRFASKRPRVLLQGARPDRFDVDFGLRSASSRAELVGERFSMPKS